MSTRARVILIVSVFAVMVAVSLIFILRADAASLPIPPPPAERYDRGPVGQCTETQFVYSHGYRSPEGNLLAVAFGLVTVVDGAASFAPPVMLLLAADAQGLHAVYHDLDGVVTRYERTEFIDKYSDACDIPGMVPKPRTPGLRTGS